MYKHYNPNPISARVGDCTVRALCKATGDDWDTVYLDLCIYGLLHADMPSANAVWGAYLRDKGFKRYLMPDKDMTVKEFSEAHKDGIYILAVSGHVVASDSGDYYDAWDSGSEIPVYYWTR